MLIYIYVFNYLVKDIYFVFVGSQILGQKFSWGEDKMEFCIYRVVFV